MASNLGAKLAVGLVHHPVLNKTGDVVTSSVTTLDVHDIARICRTYGVPEFFIITPLNAQKRLVERLTEHWIEGAGGGHNPHRKDALRSVKVVDSIDDMIDNFQFGDGKVSIITTGAKEPVGGGCATYGDARERLESMNRAVLLFGTGHGLAPSVMEMTDLRLEPIEGVGDFNHLPVRSAVAIILDRLLGYTTIGDKEK